MSESVMGVRDRLKARVAASRPEPTSPPIPWLTAGDPVAVTPKPKRTAPPKPARDPGPKPSPREHTCETCPTIIAGGKRFCRACLLLRKNARRRNERNSDHAVTCGVCQTVFITRRAVQRYCSERCSHEARLAQRRARDRGVNQYE